MNQWNLPLQGQVQFLAGLRLGAMALRRCVSFVYEIPAKFPNKGIHNAVLGSLTY